MRKSFSFAVASRVIANLCGVATAFLTIRLYNLYVSKEVYGAIIVGLQIIGYLPMMSGGFRMAVNQQMLAEPDPGRTQVIARFGQTLQSYFFLFVVFAAMAIMAAYSQLPKTHAMGIPMLVFVSSGVAAAFYFQAGSQLALLVAFGEQVTSSLIQGAWGILTVIILWVSFALGSGVWAFPISNGVGALLIIIAVRVALAWTKHETPLFVWRREPDFWPHLKAVWRSAWDCLYNQIAMTLLFTLDLILVGTLVGVGAAAVYGVVTRVMTISRQMLQSLSEAAWPRLAQELDGERRAQMMRKVDRLNAWIVGSWYGAMAVTLSPFLGWLVKADWVAGPLLTGLILARNFIVSMIGPHAYGLLGAGRFRDLARVNQQDVIVSCVAAVVLSFAMGANGIALGFLLGSVCVTAWKMTRSYFFFAHDTHWVSEWFAVWTRGLAGGGISISIASLAWFAIRTQSVSAGWLAMLVGALAFGIPAGAILLLWRVMGRIP